MTETSLIEKKELREQMAGRVEVLDKVKELFLMPKLDMLTTQQVADYYEVEFAAVKKCFLRNKEEIDTDGTMLKTPLELKGQFVPLVSTQGKYVFQVTDDTTLEVPNRGVRMFSKRAILRIGMLLRDSKIAQEVRTQLLNTFEKATAEQRVEDIQTEEAVMGEMGLAFAKGDIMAFCEATMKYNAFKDRHIIQLQQDNKVLAAEIMEWKDRSSVNKAVRLIASRLNKPYGIVWKWLYDELRYKHGMGLSQRGKAPVIQWVKENEWSNVQQTLCAICEDHGLSPSKIMRECKLMKDEEKTA